ncbi:MAG: ROK family protein [Smithella sp.]|nr:ROK family protein [Smithella sp.]
MVVDTDLVLGIDIGGTNTVFGLVDRAGIAVHAGAVPTQAGDAPEIFVARLAGAVDNLIREFPFSFRLSGIGIGVPNAHHGRGTVEKSVNLNWGEKVDLVSLMRRYYEIPVSVTNDAKAAALGEMYFGKARGMSDFIVVTLGTGMGAGIVVGGNLLYGASGFAGELGHTVADPQGRPCACGKKGCLETYVSANGLVRTVKDLLHERPDASRLRALGEGEITSKMVFELALDGDAIALEAFDRTAYLLGMKLADAVAHLSPEAIFLAGGLSAAGDILLKPARRYMNEFLFRSYRETVSLVLSGLDPATGPIVGAAALIRQELEAEKYPEKGGKETV